MDSTWKEQTALSGRHKGDPVFCTAVTSTLLLGVPVSARLLEESFLGWTKSCICATAAPRTL